MSCPFRLFVVSTVCVVGLAPGGDTALAEIPEVITYQGKVTDTGGTPVADDTYLMRFQIYDDATGGSIQWDGGDQLVVLEGGVFSVSLGQSPHPPLNLAFDEDYWLLVTFSGIAQTPRQPLASIGYAYMASGLVPGTEVAGTVATGTMAAIKGVNTATSGDTYGGYFLSSGRTGVYGAGSYGGEFFGLYRGVYGEGSGTTGTGVYGKAAATEGETSGVIGYSTSTAGRGVRGYVAATSGVSYGVHGEAVSPDGYGVYGKNIAGIAGGFEGDVRVVGTVESTNGGFKFPDGSIQTTAGLVSVTQREESYLVPPSSSYSGATCDCLAGYVLVGGGWESVRNEQPGTHDKEVQAYYDRPYHEGWEVGIWNNTAHWHHLTVFALCASAIP